MEIFETTKRVLELPPVLDLVAASSLLEAFMQHRGRAIRLDASAVQRLGGQCLQVLLAARAAWAADSQFFSIENGSDEFTASLEFLGVTQADLTHAEDAA